ncbi:MAG: ABC transporter permease [Bacteroidota bacterium]
MNTYNLLKLSMKALQKNVFRTFLTMLGIIIGVASVIAMLAIGEGSKQSIESTISDMGSNMVMVLPGSVQMGAIQMGDGTARALEMDYVEAITARSTALRHVSPMATAKVQAISDQSNWSTSVVGCYPNYLDIRSTGISAGRRFTDEEVNRNAKVCLVGMTVVEELFGPNANPIGTSIRINKVPFQIIGILEEKGGGMMGNDEDDTILAPFGTVQRRLLGITTVPQIAGSAYEKELIPVATQEIKQVLYEEMRVTAADEAFTIRTMDELSSMLTSVSDILVVLLAFVAGISLVVGGIGIMNIMYVTVVERTREIGLRMAVGAKSKHILWQFLAEAIVISFTGGIIGVLFGVLVAAGVSGLMNWPVEITSSSILMSFGFSALIGIFFGWYPARQAANLIPIQALRYE